MGPHEPEGPDGAAGAVGADGRDGADADAADRAVRPPHWSELAEQDAEDDGGIMVRPYTITRGRTAPERDDLTLITVLTTNGEAADAALARGSRSGPRALQPEHRQILDRCRRPAAVAELAAALDLPVSVTKILLGDLVAQGLLTARAPLAVARAAGDGRAGTGGGAGRGAAGLDHGLLSAVRDGLRRL
ncbi:DUF742 domain-containing protein [Streptomyces rubellomurinus]